MIFRLQVWRVLRGMLFILAIAICALAAVAGLFFVGLDIAFANHVFKGVQVEGIYVGSLSREEAIEKMRGNLDLETLNSDLVLEFDGNTWPLPLYEIDAYVDLEATVDRAMSPGWNTPFYLRWARRAVFKGVEEDVELAVHYDKQKLESFLNNLERTVNREPVDAEIKLQGRQLIFTRSQDGWLLDADQARKSIMEALSSKERIARLEIDVTPPAVSDEQLGKVITVDKQNHLLTLFSNMDIERQYPIACGMPSWPTPSGTYKIVSKQKYPTWVNPGTSWAATMPPFIPPGPGNPLGTRALATSASGVLIHGTSNSWSIGRSVSHGCIRMYMKDVEDLFERVSVGIPVLIF